MSRERREQLLDEFEKSKLSGQKFARLTGLKYSTFAAWANKRRRQRATLAPALGTSATSPAVEWLETVITDAQKAGLACASTLIVRLPSGAAVELSHGSQVGVAAALLRAWEKALC